MTAPNIHQDRAAGRFASQQSPVSRFLQTPYAGALISIILVALFLAFTQPVFATWANAMNIVRSNSVVFILALGATCVVIAGAIDLSVASLTAACSMVYGLLMVAGLPALPALLLIVAFGALLGAINGYFISYLKISYLVVTLGTLSIYQSFALILNSGTSISVFSFEAFKPLYAFVNGNIGPIPVLLLLDAVLLLILGGTLKYTGLGRAIFAIGSNREAARLNGINVPLVVMGVFIIAGLMAGIGSLVQIGRLTSAAADVDPTVLMTVLAAVLIGGTAFTGGEGGVFGTMIGVLFLGVVQNGLTLSGVSSFWQGMVSGSILIFAVWLGGVRQILRRKRHAGRS
jgi:ribose/xylose/arabinose/galactoside ABC-type transport system permease subunit